MGRLSASDTRLRSSLWFSIAVTLLLFVASAIMRPSTDDPAGAMVLVSAATGLVLANILGMWSLLTALVERRPAWRDLWGRWAWLWAFAACLAVGWRGVAGSGAQTLSSTMLYAAGVLLAASGVIGLTISALPRRPGRRP